MVVGAEPRRRRQSKRAATRDSSPSAPPNPLEKPHVPPHPTLQGVICLLA